MKSNLVCDAVRTLGAKNNKTTCPLCYNNSYSSFFLRAYVYVCTALLTANTEQFSEDNVWKGFLLLPEETNVLHERYWLGGEKGAGFGLGSARLFSPLFPLPFSSLIHKETTKQTQD